MTSLLLHTGNLQPKYIKEHLLTSSDLQLDIYNTAKLKGLLHPHFHSHLQQFLTLGFRDFISNLPYLESFLVNGKIFTIGNIVNKPDFNYQSQFLRITLLKLLSFCLPPEKRVIFDKPDIHLLIHHTEEYMKIYKQIFKLLTFLKAPDVILWWFFQVPTYQDNIDNIKKYRITLNKLSLELLDLITDEIKFKQPTYNIKIKLSSISCFQICSKGSTYYYNLCYNGTSNREIIYNINNFLDAIYPNLKYISPKCQKYYINDKNIYGIHDFKIKNLLQLWDKLKDNTITLQELELLNNLSSNNTSNNILYNTLNLNNNANNKLNLNNNANNKLNLNNNVNNNNTNNAINYNNTLNLNNNVNNNNVNNAINYNNTLNLNNNVNNNNVNNNNVNNNNVNNNNVNNNNVKKYIKNKIGNEVSRIKIIFITNKFLNYTSVFRDRIGIIYNLDRRFFDIYIGLFTNLKDVNYKTKIINKIRSVNVLNHYLDYFIKNDKIIYLDNIYLQYNQTLLEEQQFNIIFYPDIGMLQAQTLLAHSRLAPIQCVTWGHSDTSGLSRQVMDYYITSQYFENINNLDDVKNNYTEKPILLPSLGTFYYSPRELVDTYFNPSFEQFMITKEGFGFPKDAIIIGCLQSFYKFNEEFEHVLSLIMDRCKLLHNKKIYLALCNSFPFNKLHITRLNNYLKKYKHQIKWFQNLEPHKWLNLVSICHIMLDPFPFGGCNTTLEAFDYGIPVICKPSNLINGRFTLGFINKIIEDINDNDNIIHKCLVANTNEEYVNLAIKLLNDNTRYNYISKMIKEGVNKLFQDRNSLNDYEKLFIDLTKKHLINT
jgi:predicted O-linked N-acetylglucosamine transferase (SPINDLY family)